MDKILGRDLSMKRILKRNCKRIINILPVRFLLLIENVINNPDLKWYIQGIRLRKFVEHTDFFKLDTSEMSVCSIQKGEWEFPLFQMYFMTEMISLSIDCLSKGYLPQIDYINKEGINLWEQFLVQPCEVLGRNINHSTEKVSELTKANFSIPVFLTDEDIAIYNKIICHFVVLNDATNDYFNDEYEKLFNNKGKIIGVLCRGTDYTVNKPKNHPVQPEVSEIIEKVRETIIKYSCTYIYLATEEESIKKQFEEAFPGKILTNKRKYYDGFYDLKKDGGDDTRISWVHFDRNNDSYYKSLEYFSSINLLSKCDLLVAGNTGGSRMAMVLNNNRYEYAYLFDKGVY